MVVYKTTNLINGKWYVGKDALNATAYIGSGKAFRNALKKYGKLIDGKRSWFNKEGETS